MLSSKRNVLGVRKEHFSVFCKFLSDEVEAIFWEYDAKRPKLLKSEIGQSQLVRKIFFCLKFKKECSELLKKPFLSFLLMFQRRSWNHFFGKVRRSLQNYLNQYLVIARFSEKCFEAILKFCYFECSEIWKNDFLTFCKSFNDGVESHKVESRS